MTHTLFHSSVSFVHYKAATSAYIVISPFATNVCFCSTSSHIAKWRHTRLLRATYVFCSQHYSLRLPPGSYWSYSGLSIHPKGTLRIQFGIKKPSKETCWTNVRQGATHTRTPPNSRSHVQLPVHYF